MEAPLGVVNRKWVPRELLLKGAPGVGMEGRGSGSVKGSKRGVEEEEMVKSSAQPAQRSSREVHMTQFF